MGISTATFTRMLVTGAAVLGGLMMPAMPALAADVAGSKDHPVISRYQGSSIVRYSYAEYTDFHLLKSRINKAVSYGGVLDEDNSIYLEGKLTRISYEVPAGRSTLEVFRNYEDEMKKAGFEEIFQCDNQACGGRDFNLTVVPYWGGFGGNWEDQRYLAARLSRPEGDIYVALYVDRNYSAGGPTHDRIYAQLDVIEIKPMQTGMVTVDADAMSKAIAETGSIALYGIYFDTDKATIKPESKAALDEIAKLMSKQPDLKLVVVGHTDNVGKLEYNMDLSKRRAEAVQAALVTDYGIDASRLKAWGIGFLSPVASNQSEEGRSKNRRVVLVEQ